MPNIVEIKKMWNEDLGRKTLIMFLSCGHPEDSQGKGNQLEASTRLDS
jgi:hypothetical protein